MRKFSENQNCLYYLSPYVAVKSFDDNVIMHQRLFDIFDQKRISQAAAGPLLDGLTTGVTEVQLKELLRADRSINDPDSLIKWWMQTGMLE